MKSKTVFILAVVTLAFCASQVLSVECPEPSDTPDYLPDPTNCSRYYLCSNGIPYLLDCPFPLVWDPTANTCTSPGLYHCEPTTTVAPPETTTLPTSPVPTDVTGEPSTTYIPTETTQKPTEVHSSVFTLMPESYPISSSRPF